MKCVCLSASYVIFLLFEFFHAASSFCPMRRWISGATCSALCSSSSLACTTWCRSSRQSAPPGKITSSTPSDSSAFRYRASARWTQSCSVYIWTFSLWQKSQFLVDFRQKHVYMRVGVAVLDSAFNKQFAPVLVWVYVTKGSLNECDLFIMDVVITHGRKSTSLERIRKQHLTSSPLVQTLWFSSCSNDRRFITSFSSVLFQPSLAATTPSCLCCSAGV